MPGVWIWKINVSKCLGDRKHGSKLFRKCLIRVFQNAFQTATTTAGWETMTGRAPCNIHALARGPPSENRNRARESTRLYVYVYTTYYIYLMWYYNTFLVTYCTCTTYTLYARILYYTISCVCSIIYYTVCRTHASTYDDGDIIRDRACV